MLTNERFELIMNKLATHKTVKITELIEATDASESTIRRDLTELETLNKLQRIHGGATLPDRDMQELSISAKSEKYFSEKVKVASLAASIVNEGDFIYLDAGTTTFQMIPFLKDRNITVVTNGLTHVESLTEHGISSYLIGGYVKATTGALVGQQARNSLKQYHFNKCFLGTNGVDPVHGYTTPDPDEATVKSLAAEKSRTTYIVADHSKVKKSSFIKFLSIEEAVLIIDEMPEDILNELEEKTLVKVVQK
ncbi:DeoR family transcriptional regulator [Sporosarcina sp. P20a]|uniref:DeoR/GlpR family DNA-binding transcription regulator n=1 Tax=Sporosarcina sp. P20a TaxID=2048256 RepID=UPI000C16A4F5|nr:DeoR/GlpR family DNA-binding transcription regulator [Sporosarcina sp. P20a]PIC86593.1 DeoR family transcriptional regulator [Sporosarcina sp. P20a]